MENLLLFSLAAMIVLKLASIIDWPWWVVLSPGLVLAATVLAFVGYVQIPYWWNTRRLRRPR